MPRQLAQFRHLWLIALMVLSLSAVQLVQASALHDHSRDVVTCALCHVPLSDDPAEYHSSPLPVFITRSLTAAQLTELPATSRNPAPYQGRAPPLTFL